METSTIRTAQVNYANRPQQNQERWPPAPKRPNQMPQQPNYPSKLQRNFHIEASPQEDSAAQLNPSVQEVELQQYYAVPQSLDHKFEQSFNNYV